MQSNADIKELAIAAWRLEKWLNNLNSDRKMAAKSALRSIKKYIAALSVEVVDPIGAKFDPGLAIEVANNEAPEAPEDELIIIETLAPYVYQNGELIQHARVIIGTLVKEAKKSNEIVDESPQTIIGEQSAAASKSVPPEKSQNDDVSEERADIRKEDIERMIEYAKIL